MTILKYLKRLLWDVWAVPYNIFRDISARPDCSLTSVRELYEKGLHVSSIKLDNEQLVELQGIYKDLLANTDVAESGQGAGRISTNGLLDNRLESIIEPMRDIASKYLCVDSAKLELTYFQESKPRNDLDSVPGGEFHIDDNKSNIKFFVYLTNVGNENGPFVVVPGTHRWKDSKRIFRALRWALTKKRNVLYYKMNTAPLDLKAKYITGSAGTFFIADTTAWHRAEPVKIGERLVFVTSFNR